MDAGAGRVDVCEPLTIEDVFSRSEAKTGVTKTYGAKVRYVIRSLSQRLCISHALTFVCLAGALELQQSQLDEASAVSVSQDRERLGIVIWCRQKLQVGISKSISLLCACLAKSVGPQAILGT